MPSSGRPLFIHYTAWDPGVQTDRQGDAENHILIWIKDGVPAEVTNTPVEITYNDLHLCYGLQLTALETACNSGTLVGWSSTPNTIILKRHIVFDQILGSGIVLVDHNYGGKDNLTFLSPNGTGIEGGVIQAFAKSDWDAGIRNRSAIAAETTTDAAGHWVREMALVPGDYVLVFFKPGFYAPITQEITVTAS